MLKRIFFTWLTFASFSAASGQVPQQFFFTHFSTSTGLLSNQVNSVVQDEKGYIWMATTDGLVRFDGIRYKVFRHRDNDPFSISANALLQVLIDAEKTLWLLTADGHVGSFSTKDFTFHGARVRCKDATALKSGMKRLITDREKNIFLMVGGNALLTFSKPHNEFAADYNFFSAPSEWGYTAFQQQPGTRKYWMGIQGGGIAIFNRETGKLSYTNNNIEHEPAIDFYATAPLASNFLFDRKGRVWFTSWGPGIPYVHCYDTATHQRVLEKYEFYSVLKAYNEANNFFEQSDGTIWITGLRVFAHYNEAQKNFVMVPAGYTNERSIDYRQISGLYEDRDHNIWVGTGNNGAFMFNPSQTFFANIGHPSKKPGQPGDGNPMSFAVDKDSTILVGIWGEGFYRYDKNWNSIPLNIRCREDINTMLIWSMFPSQDNRTMWLSAQPGLIAYDQIKRTAVFHNPPLLENRTVRQVVEDKKGNLWLGMQAIGVYKWNKEKGSKNFDEGISKFTAVPPGQINFMHIDRKGYVWICTRSDGVYVVDPETDSVLLRFHQDAAAELQLPEDRISSLLEYDDSLMVITTATHIVLYNRVLKKSRPIGSPDLISGFITAIQRDDAGYLWMSTSSALYRINISKNIFIRYNRDDGITSDFFLIAASCHLPDGRLLFGAAGQFVVFDPTQLAAGHAKNAGEIIVTDFLVMNKELQVDSLMQLNHVQLNHDQNSLVIQFSQLSFIADMIVQYKMEGLDKDWKTSDQDKHAIYSYLPPGSYHLVFRTLNTEGVPKLSNLQFTITISPPFWKTWWFFGLLGLLLSGLAYWVDREWMRRKAVIQKMRTDIAGNLHEEVNIALNNINILSEMALIKSAKEPEKSKEFMQQIHTRSHNMIIAMDDMLWSLSPDNDSMEKTVDRMREYIDALKNRHGLTIDLFVNPGIGRLELNMKLRHEAFVLFKEAIKSLVTAGVQRCAIDIQFEKNRLQYTMQFANAGCDMQQLNNLLQRQDMEKRMNAINATLNVEVHKTSSVFILQVPV